MTQSDAPNEGREEKQPWTYDVDVHGTAFCFYKHNDFKFKANEPDLCKVLNEYEDLRDQLSELQQQLDASLRNTTRLLDQLSKERELTQTKVDYYENKLESMQRSLDMWYGDLVKEREMRKEFVEGLEGLERLFYAGYTIRPGDLNKLIKKATELDKK